MILDLLGGLIMILFAMAFAYAVSLAVTFWFISIPLAILWVWWRVQYDRQHPRPPISAKAQADIDWFRAREDHYRQIAKNQKAEGRGR